MNPGHTIFKRAQRLQGGTGKLPDNEEDLPPEVLRWLQEEYNRKQLPPQQDLERELRQNEKLRRKYEQSSEKYLLAQGGTDDVYHRDELFFRPGHTPSSKEASRLYDPGEYVPPLDDEQGHDDLAKSVIGDWKPDSYRTVGVEIDGKEIEVPQWGGQTINEAEEMARMRLEWGLDPFVPDEELERVQNAAHMGPDDASALPPPTPEEARKRAMNEYAQGTSNVGSNIFKNAQRMQSGMQVVNNLGYDPSKPTRGFGSGEPTRRGIDIGVSGAVNVFLPGFGWVAGKIARGLWHTIQNMRMNGASKQDIQQVVQQAQQQQDEQPEAPAAPTTAPPTTPATPSAGVGIDPWGNPADPGEWWSNDFGRWNTDQYGTTPGDYNLQGPGGQFGTRGLNFSAQSNIGGSGTVGNFATAIGFDGPFGGGISAGDTSRFRGQAGYSHPYTEAQYNAPTSTHGTGQGPGYQLGPGWTPRASYEQYVAGFHAPGTVGSSTGPGGAAVGGTGGPQGGMKQFIGHTPRRAAFAMGTSSVNQGSKLFHAQLKRKK